MADILDDTTKFKTLDNVRECNKTAVQEQRLQRELLWFYNEQLILRESQRPRLYELTKIHKQNILFRPILFMVCFAQQRLAKWLANILESVVQFYSRHCISDLFTFENQIQNIPIDCNNSFFCSIDIVRLYTNVLLDEIITICVDILYHLDLHPVPENVFFKLMHIATKCVQFSFNNTMFQQVDGISMGSSLETANIICRISKRKIVKNQQQTSILQTVR